MQLIVSQDVEQGVIDELTGLSFPLGTGIPANAQTLQRFARVLAAGGAPRDMVTDEFIVTIEMFSRTESDAREQLALIVARLEAASRQNKLGTLTCYGVRSVALPQNYPLPSVPTHKRYITTIAPAIRRAVVNL